MMRREDDADDRHLQRIEHAHHQHPEIGVGGAVRDGAFADVETGLALEKPQPGRDVAGSPGWSACC